MSSVRGHSHGIDPVEDRVLHVHVMQMSHRADPGGLEERAQEGAMEVHK